MRVKNNCRAAAGLCLSLSPPHFLPSQYPRYQVTAAVSGSFSRKNLIWTERGTGKFSGDAQDQIDQTTPTSPQLTEISSSYTWALLPPSGTQLK